MSDEKESFAHIDYIECDSSEVRNYWTCIIKSYDQKTKDALDNPIDYVEGFRMSNINESILEGKNYVLFDFKDKNIFCTFDGIELECDKQFVLEDVFKE